MRYFRACQTRIAGFCYVVTHPQKNPTIALNATKRCSEIEQANFKQEDEDRLLISMFVPQYKLQNRKCFSSLVQLN